MDPVKLKAGKALFSRARAILTLTQPFFAGVMLKFDIVWTEVIPTAQILPLHRQIRINPEFVFEEVTDVARMIFLICHECFHYMDMYDERIGDRHPKRWNCAADSVANEILIKAGIGTFIEEGWRYPGAEAMNNEQVYDLLEGKEPDWDYVIIGGIGNDIPEDIKLSPAELTKLKLQIKSDVALASRGAKMCGSLPQGVEAIVDKILKVNTPWHTILERHATSLVVGDVSWQRPSKRGLYSEVYLPGYNKQPSIGTVVVAVDTSGSVSMEEHSEFAGHISRIISMCNPKRVIRICCDAEVQSMEEIEDCNIDAIKVIHGGGGTIFQPVFDLVDKEDINPDMLVYLTDGYGDEPVFNSDYPVFWATTSGECSANFGIIVDLSKKGN